MLKAASAVLVMLALALEPAVARSASVLLTGAVRDQSGAAVIGARVTALDAAGHDIGHDVALADGTFALEAPAAPKTLVVACDYCRTVARALGPGDAPIVVIVARFDAVTRAGASPADIAALPLRRAADIASLRPFTVVDGGRIRDRGLAPYAATLVDGLPFYSAADGDDYSRLVPAHAVAALDAASPLFAPQYGGYASAGIYDIRSIDREGPGARSDSGDGFDLAAAIRTSGADAVYGASSDPGDVRHAVAAAAQVAAGGGNLGVNVLAMDDATSHASGAGLTYVTQSRRYTTSALLDATRSDDASLLSFAARIRNRGPLALEFGLRASRATSRITSGAAAQFDGALYAGATRRVGTASFTANLAADRGGNAGDAGNVRAAALVGSIGSDLQLGPQWSVHSGIVSNLRIPTFAETAFVAPHPAAGDRSLLFEQSATYTDLRRLRVGAQAYTQRTTGPRLSRVSGIGIDVGWQIAPHLSLRTWLLRANEALVPAYSATAALRRQVAWFTYDNGVRFDALVRGGALEGDVRVPLRANLALALGTTRYESTRVTTFGLVLR